MFTDKRTIAIAMQAIIGILILMPLFSFFFSFSFIIPAIILNAGYLILLQYWKNHYKQDFKRIAMLFLGLLIVGDIAVISAEIFVDITTGTKAFFVVAMAALVFIFISKKLIMRDFTYGKILLIDTKNAAVETDFDILAGCVKGKYVVETTKKYKKGETVKIHMKNTFFGKKPTKILE